MSSPFVIKSVLVEKSNHLKVLQRFLYCFFFLLWTVRLSGILGFRQIEISPHIESELPLYLGNVQIRHMEPVLFLYPFLDLIIGRTGLQAGRIQILQIEFHPDMLC